MTEELDIEETKRLCEFGIIVFRNGTHRTYYRPRKYSEEERKKEKTAYSEPLYELIPLTSEERKKYNIEESALSDSNEIDIEESEHTETEEEKKKSNLTLKGSPEVVQSAKAILEKEMAKKTDNDLATLKLQAYQKFKNTMFLEAKDPETLSAMLTNYISELAERANRARECSTVWSKKRRPLHAEVFRQSTDGKRT
jgi:hypothetical protein